MCHWSFRCVGAAKTWTPRELRSSAPSSFASRNAARVLTRASQNSTQVGWPRNGGRQRFDGNGSYQPPLSPSLAISKAPTISSDSPPSWKIVRLKDNQHPVYAIGAPATISFGFDLLSSSLLCPAFRTKRPRAFKAVSFRIVCSWTNF